MTDDNIDIKHLLQFSACPSENIMAKYMTHALSSTHERNEDEHTALFDFIVVSENHNLLRFTLGAAIIQIKNRVRSKVHESSIKICDFSLLCC